MKKVKLTRLLLVLVPVASILLYCCTKKDITQTPATEKTARAAALQNSAAVTSGASDTCGSCSSSYSGSHSGKGYWVYYQPLDLSCSQSSGQVTVSCTYYDVPNNFSVQDKNGQTVTNTTGGYCSTGWIGNASCPGPWGQNGVNTLQAVTNISFYYNPALAPYRLKVETTVIGCTNCGSNNPGCTNLSDTWNVGVNCSKKN